MPDGRSGGGGTSANTSLRSIRNSCVFRLALTTDAVKCLLPNFPHVPLRLVFTSTAESTLLFSLVVFL